MRRAKRRPNQAWLLTFSIICLSAFFDTCVGSASGSEKLSERLMAGEKGVLKALPEHSRFGPAFVLV